MGGMWFLVVLFMPGDGGEGLIMGWSKAYPTYEACRTAQQEATKFGAGPKTAMISQCQQR